VPENDQVATGVGLWIIVWNVSLFALATKRLHDLGISGWWLLGFLIVFAVLVGTRQDVLASIGSAALFAGDPPPLKWSDLRYVFDIKEDCNGKEAIQA
jgi:uncharacterized membrane protein YhaH (DUF805 family)